MSKISELKRSRNSTYKLMVTLEELYNGSVRHLRITEHTKCLLCKYILIIDGPDGAKNCKRCHGPTLQSKNRFVPIKIRKGMRHGQRIIFEGGGIREPNKEPGHLIVTLEQKEHPIFRRKCNDLFMLIQITIEEVKLGFQRILPTLDGRRLILTNARGEDINGTTVLGEGMPWLTEDNNCCKGQLFINFEIVP